MGYTNDLQRRYEEHLSGSAKCKYTRSFKPLGIAQSWQVVGTKAEAMKVEKYIKMLSRKRKEEIVVYPEKLVSVFVEQAIKIKAAETLF